MSQFWENLKNFVAPSNGGHGAVPANPENGSSDAPMAGMTAKSNGNEATANSTDNLGKPTNTKVENAFANTPAATGTQSQLDQLAAIWQNKDADKATDSMFNLDNETLDKTLAGVDFLQGVDPSLGQKALSGDPQSLAQLINSAVRNATKMQMQATTRAVEHGVEFGSKRTTDNVMSQVRSQQVQQQIAADNEIFNHPAAQPIVGPLLQQLQKQYPQQTPEQIKEHALSYLQTVFPGWKGGKNGNGQSQNQDVRRSKRIDTTFEDF